MRNACFVIASVVLSVRPVSSAQPDFTPVRNIYTFAECVGPRGTYQTSIWSDDRTTVFKQEFSFKSDRVGYRLTEKDTCQIGGERITPLETFVGQSHDFVRLALQPDYLMTGLKTEERTGDTVIVNGRTKMGFRMSYKMLAADRRPIGHDLYIDDGHSTTHIRWIYGQWSKQGLFIIPMRVSIRQGEKTFEFRYTDVRINEKSWTPPKCADL